MPAGFVTLAWSASSGLIHLTLATYGFSSRSSHATALRPGPCSQGDAATTLAGFPDVNADAHGVVNTTLGSVESTSRPPTAHFDVLLGATGSSGAGSTRIGCADLPSGNATGPLQLPSSSGSPPTATAIVALLAPGRIQVHLVASGLTPSSVHALAIHFGSCEAQSVPAANFRDVTANAEGRIDAQLQTTSGQLDLRAVSWYLELPLGASSQLSAGGEATFLAQPVLCGDYLR